MKLSHIIGFMCIFSLLLFAGCAYRPIGSLYTDVSLPMHVDSDLAKEFSLYPDKFEVLGFVEGVSSNMNVLGLVALGAGGYKEAVEDAKAKVGADGLVDVVTDMRITGFFGIFTEWKTVVTGRAIKRK